MARFFIDRPIFAWVIAIVIMLAGALSIQQLPVSQYPSIAPPAVVINARYPGASAKAVEDSVTQIIEQKMTGLDGLLYMKSTSDSYGSAAVTLTFSADTDPDIAQVQVQNKMQTALPLLPQAVQQQGVTVAKSAANFLMVVGFVSTDDRLEGDDLSDFLVASIQDPLSRVDGVGEVQVFGAQYAMRIWLDPAKLTNFHLTPGDVRAALLAQNAEVSAGQLGGTPAVPGQGFSATITAQSRLQTVEQFEDVLLRSNTQGGEVRLKDVARVEIGAENYGFSARFNGKPASGIGIRLASGANALETADAVRARLDELRPYFPAGVDYVVPYDTTPFVKISIESVVMTLIEAVVLVFLVMYLFLQNLRATLIPTMAIPVVLLGTFGLMAAFGFSINTLTMFGMVLAIGLLVDDAIVVVENVERVMSEEGLPPKEATRRSMDQITSALVGIGLVLSAVFVPMAFFGGSTGVIYRQFSITIVSAMALSVLVAIVFTPALCATILKPVEKGHEHGEGGLFGRFFHWFNLKFDRSTKGYETAVGGILKRSVRFLAIYVAIVAVLGLLFVRMPTSFLPEEDQGVIFNQIMLPAGATKERTLGVIEKVEQHFLENEKDTVKAVFTVAGFSFGGTGQNMGIAFVNMRHWDERQAPGMDVKSVAARAMGAYQQIREAMVFAFVPPARSSSAPRAASPCRCRTAPASATMPCSPRATSSSAWRRRTNAWSACGQMVRRTRPSSSSTSTTPRLVRWACRSPTSTRPCPPPGGSYINDFLDRGRIKKVYLQGDAPARMTPEDLDKWYVRNKAGDMVPFSAFATSYWAFGSPRLERFNGQPSMEILGQAAPGLSSGEAMQAVEDIMGKMPPGIGYDWSGTSVRGTPLLARRRRPSTPCPCWWSSCAWRHCTSWSVPFAVMLVVPLGVLGALLAASPVAACPTTSTSRSACSPPSACRRRTRS